jgi:hypothetical protein
MAMTLTALCNRNRQTGWYMGKSRRARVGECEAVAGSPCVPAFSRCDPLQPGAARRCACFGKPRANRSEQYTHKMKQPVRAAERQPSELRVKCRSCVLCSHAAFYVRRVFAGRPGVLLATVVLLFTPATPCLHRRSTWHNANNHTPTPRIAAVLALVSPGCPLFHQRPHLQPTRGPNEAISCSFMQFKGRCRSGPSNRQRADRSTTALVLHTMIVDAAPVGPSGGLSYHVCGFVAKLRATVPVNRLSRVSWLREPRSSQDAHFV